MKLIRTAAIGLVLAFAALSGCASSGKQQFSEKLTKYHIAYSNIFN